MLAFFAAMTLSDTLKAILAKEVLDNKIVLLGSLGGNITRNLRVATWEAIRQKLLDHGAEDMTVKHLRDQLWGNLRRAVSAKYQKSCQSGAAGVKFKRHEKLVLDAICRKNLEPLGVPDVPPNFSQPTLHTVTLDLDSVPFVYQDDDESSDAGGNKKNS